MGIHKGERLLVAVVDNDLQSEIGALAVLGGIADMGGVVANSTRAYRPVYR